jgi:hypothetical protein
LHAHQLQAQAAHSVQDAVEVRLVTDHADQASLSLPRFEGHAFERGPETLGQPPSHADPVSRRFHVASARVTFTVRLAGGTRHPPGLLSPRGDSGVTLVFWRPGAAAPQIPARK